MLCFGSSFTLVPSTAPNFGSAKTSWMKPGEVSREMNFGTEKQTARHVNTGQKGLHARSAKYQGSDSPFSN